jgi:hypothetical protein
MRVSPAGGDAVREGDGPIRWLRGAEAPLEALDFGRPHLNYSHHNTGGFLISIPSDQVEDGRRLRRAVPWKKHDSLYTTSDAKHGIQRVGRRPWAVGVHHPTLGMGPVTTTSTRARPQETPRRPDRS